MLCTKVSVCTDFACMCHLRDRGPCVYLVPLQAIAESEVVLRVPMRLALTDFADDGPHARVGTPEGAHWAVRLAAKLLLERAGGSSSPWYPYLQADLLTSTEHSMGVALYHCTLSEKMHHRSRCQTSIFTKYRAGGDRDSAVQALPEHVWTPLRLLDEMKLKQLQYQPVIRAVHSQRAFIQDAVTQLSAHAVDGVSYEAVSWAMSVWTPQLQRRSSVACVMQLLRPAPYHA